MESDRKVGRQGGGALKYNKKLDSGSSASI